MNNNKIKVLAITSIMALSLNSFVYANTNTQALPNGTIISQNGRKYLADTKGKKYSGWFIDSKEDWYYFNETDKAMKTGWHHDDKDGYWYYLNLSNGKMVTGWQAIDGKEYFFQPVRDMGNYYFNNEQEKWLYSVNSNIPYGAMYVNTITPDGTKVDNNGAKVGTTDENDTNGKNTTAVKNGWIAQEGKWYYYESDIMAKSKWLHLSGKWYYVSQDGVMVSNGWKEIDGKTYYFGSDGAMYINTITPDGTKVDKNGVKSIMSDQKDYSQYIGDYAVMENPVEMGNVYWGGVFKITKISDGKIYGIYESQASATNNKIEIDFSNGVSINDNAFSIKGISSIGAGYITGDWTSDEWVTEEYRMECKLDTLNGKCIIRTLEEDTINSIYYKTLKPIENY